MAQHMHENQGFELSNDACFQSPFKLMSGPSELSRRRRARTMALFAGVGVALLGATALAGWLLHAEALKTIIPGSNYPIKPNIATGMLLCGAALSLLSGKTLGKPIRICTAAIAITVILGQPYDRSAQRTQVSGCARPYCRRRGNSASGAKSCTDQGY